MTPEERALVDELFGRLAGLENTPRDPSAERLIADGLISAPHAVYALVQTTLVQDEALKRANARIEELQAQVGGQEQQRSGSFLDSMRDAVLGRSDPRASVPSVRSQTQSSPWIAPPYRPQPGYPPQSGSYPPGPGGSPSMAPGFGSGGSFLGTAASTAAGVIGGGLLLNSIRSMFGDHAGVGEHEPRGLRSAGVSDLAQQDRDQDQDQDQDDADQAQADQDQDQDQDQDDTAGDFGGDDTDSV
jgi:uncharacterized protein